MFLESLQWVPERGPWSCLKGSKKLENIYTYIKLTRKNGSRNLGATTIYITYICVYLLIVSTTNMLQAASLKELQSEYIHMIYLPWPYLQLQAPTASKLHDACIFFCTTYQELWDTLIRIGNTRLPFACLSLTLISLFIWFIYHDPTYNFKLIQQPLNCVMHV